MTALMLAARERDIGITRDLPRLGADTLDRDNMGRSARDFAASLKLPAILNAIPQPTFPVTLGHIAHQPRFWLVAVACLFAAGVACAP